MWFRKVDYKAKVLALQPTAKLYKMDYMGVFYFVVYDSVSTRHYERNENKAWKSVYKQLKK